MYKLEDRVLFDGALPVDLADLPVEVDQQSTGEEEVIAHDAGHNGDVQAGFEDEQTTSGASSELSEALTDLTAFSIKELYIVDTAVPNYQSLLEAIPNNAEILMIDYSEDSLETILSRLDYSEPYDVVHVLSHGSGGEIRIGKTEITADNVSLYNDQLKALGSFLESDGDILFYGCDIAKSTDGQSLISQIAQLTSADIAASDNTTGAGGDWKLEFTVGSIQAKELFVEDYSGAMSNPTITDIEDEQFAIGETITITGSEFNATQGTGNVYLSTDNVLDSDDVVQSVTSWSDVSIDITIDLGELDEGNLYLLVQNDLDGISSAEAIGVWHKWTPDDTTDALSWFDASDTTTITQSGNMVSQWVDKSGNNQTVTQTEGTMQPETELEGHEINGLNTLYFHEDRLITDSTIGNNLAGEEFATHIVVARNSREAANDYFMGTLGATQGESLVLGYNRNHSTISMSYFGNGVEVATAGYSFPREVQLWSFVQTSTGRSVYLNGELLGGDSNTMLLDGNQQFIIGGAGKDEYMMNDKDVGEIVNLSLTSKGGIELAQGYLADKWGITLVDGHTYKDEAPLAKLNILNAEDGEFVDGESVTINGMKFGDLNDIVKVELGTSDDYSTAVKVEQEITSWSDKSITFTADLGENLSEGELNLYVTNNFGERQMYASAVTVGHEWDINSIASTLSGWWDATDTNTITIDGESGLVSEWGDKSGNGYIVSQIDDSLQPETGISDNEINGLNALHFDDDLMIAVDENGDGSGNNLAGGEFAAHIVLAKNSVYGGSDYVMGTLGETEGESLSLGFRDDNSASMGYFGSVLHRSIAEYSGSREIQLLSFVQTSSGRSVYLNGELVGADANTVFLSGNQNLAIGGGAREEYMVNNTDIGEIITLSDTSSTSNDLFQNYLADKWGISLSPGNSYADGGKVVVTQITDAGDERFYNGETVTVTGTNFGALRSNNVKVWLSNNAQYGVGTMVEQSTSFGGDSSAEFVVNKGTLSEGQLYLFVTNDRGGRSQSYAVTLDDTTAPIVDAQTPTSGGDGVDVSANLTMSFNEVVVEGTGTITLHRTDHSSVVETFDLDGDQVLPVGVTLSTDGTMITINPSADLEHGTEYYVTMTAGAVTDVAGNGVSAITTATGWTFATSEIAEQSSLSDYVVVDVPVEASFESNYIDSVVSDVDLNMPLSLSIEGKSGDGVTTRIVELYTEPESVAVQMNVITASVTLQSAPRYQLNNFSASTLSLLLEQEIVGPSDLNMSDVLPAGRSNAIFNSLDANDNGAIDLDEFKRFYDSDQFSEDDLNDDGVINDDEWREMLKKNRLKPLGTDILNLLNQANYTLEDPHQVAGAFQSSLDRNLQQLVAQVSS